MACMDAFWRFVNSLKALLLLLFARLLVVTHCHSLSAPAWRSTADPVASTWRQICCTVLNFHCLCGYMHELLLLFRIPAHALSAFAFFHMRHLSHVTALTKCSLLTNIRKITSCLFTISSARLIDITVKSVLLSCRL